MKIFISHSSKDKWAARRISDDLIEIGSETFLDEKDIKTGESIDSSIKKNLSECNHFLIILSPASIKSDWVLLELGGAFALEKKIIPVLLYVGANEIPQAINLRLARDINTIDLYYKEVEDEIKGKKPTRKKSKKKSNNQFISGEIVRIINKRPNDVYRNDNLVDWEEPMDKYLGKVTKIVDVEDPEDSNWHDTYSLEIDNEHYVWASEWLMSVDE